MDASRLAAIPIFHGLEPHDLAALADAATEIEATEGETIVAQGDFGHALYVIERGSAEVRIDCEHVRLLAAGEVFGEIAVTVAGRRTATVVATSPLRAIAIFKRDVWALEIATSPLRAIAIFKRDVWALERRSPEAAARLRRLAADRRPPPAENP